MHYTSVSYLIYRIYVNHEDESQTFAYNISSCTLKFQQMMNNESINASQVCQIVLQNIDFLSKIDPKGWNDKNQVMRQMLQWNKFDNTKEMYVQHICITCSHQIYI